jgi:hypothetical protein
MTHQGTALCIYYWRIVGKADGTLKEDGVLKEGTLEKGNYLKLKEGKVVREGCV